MIYAGIPNNGLQNDPQGFTDAKKIRLQNPPQGMCKSILLCISEI